MDAEQKKSRTMLRLMVSGLGVAIVGMAGWNEGAETGLTVLVVMAPLLLLGYVLLRRLARCPSCGEPFALEPGERGVLLTSHTCRYCGCQVERISGGRGPGGGV